VVSIWVTGSADGIGRETVAQLVRLGHQVTLHARDTDRAEQALAAVPGAAGALVGDLASLDETRLLAQDADRLGRFDVVIHNCGVQERGEHRPVTEDGLERTFQVNVLAPYLLTALLPRPSRLIYLTSGLEAQGVADFADLQREQRRWDGMAAYCDSKLLDVVLAFAVARRWPGVVSNAVDPGWIKTRMGGPHATDELADGAETQVWLATSDDPEALGSGRYLKRRQTLTANPAAYAEDTQERLLAACAELTGVPLPA
jgi:NAD(P)-dependent dehydrogenase (short-subunit alcohol dehydrogenase family)